MAESRKVDIPMSQNEDTCDDMSYAERRRAVFAKLAENRAAKESLVAKKQMIETLPETEEEEEILNSTQPKGRKRTSIESKLEGAVVEWLADEELTVVDEPSKKIIKLESDDQESRSQKKKK